MTDTKSTTLSFQEEATIRYACETLLLQFMAAVDTFDYEKTIELFSEDCCLDIAGDKIIGKQALAIWLNNRPANRKTRHICTNILFDRLSTEKATSSAVITLYAATSDKRDQQPPLIAGPAAIVDLTNEFSLTPFGWKIDKHAVAFSFINQ